MNLKYIAYSVSLKTFNNYCRERIFTVIGMVFTIACFSCSTFYRALAQSRSLQLIRTAWNDPEVKRMEGLISFLDHSSIGIHRLNKMELRTETNEFNLKQQEYGLRFYNTDFNEIKYRSQMQQINKSHYEQLRQIALHQAISYRYELIAKSFEIKRNQDLLMDKKAFADKKLKFYQMLIQSQMQTDLKDYISTVRDKLKIENEISIRGDQLKLLTAKWQAAGYSGELMMDTVQTISVETIRTVLLFESNHTFPSDESTEKYIYKTQLVAAEETKTKTEKWNVLDFVQLRFRNNIKDNLFKEKVTIGAGFRIPYSGTTKMELNKLNFEKLQLESEKEKAIADRLQKIKLLQIEINQFADQLIYSREKMNDFKLKFQPVMQAEPALNILENRLVIEEEMIKWSEDLINLEQKLIIKYIDYLSITGLISRSPVLNYFDNKLALVIKE